jgi:CelD/BcsL family acetyltransferase involved in cellulose biosynthesis
LRRADEAGIQVEWVDKVADETTREALFQRALAVDARSWKGQSGQGLLASEMATFYDRMTARLHEVGGLRMLFLRMGERDVAMGFGAVFGDTFRGLQMSFDDAYRAYAPGNLVQAKLIEHLCEAGTAHYDLGTDMGYKSRWAEAGLETAALVIRPSM